MSLSQKAIFPIAKRPEARQKANFLTLWGKASAIDHAVSSADPR